MRVLWSENVMLRRRVIKEIVRMYNKQSAVADTKKSQLSELWRGKCQRYNGWKLCITVGTTDSCEMKWKVYESNEQHAGNISYN